MFVSCCCDNPCLYNNWIFPFSQTSTSESNKSHSLGVRGALCTDLTTYDFDAPTKQSLLCSGLSAYEVILGQLPGGSQGASQEEFVEPEFRLSLRASSRRRYIFVLDVSRQMEGRWSRVRNALYRFIDAWVGVGDEVALVTFGRQAHIKMRPKQITESNRWETPAFAFWFELRADFMPKLLLKLLLPTIWINISIFTICRQLFGLLSE